MRLEACRRGAADARAIDELAAVARGFERPLAEDGLRVPGLAPRRDLRGSAAAAAGAVTAGSGGHQSSAAQAWAGGHDRDCSGASEGRCGRAAAIRARAMVWLTAG